VCVGCSQTGATRQRSPLRADYAVLLHARRPELSSPCQGGPYRAPACSRRAPSPAGRWRRSRGPPVRTRRRGRPGAVSVSGCSSPSGRAPRPTGFTVGAPHSPPRSALPECHTPALPPVTSVSMTPSGKLVSRPTCGMTSGAVSGSRSRGSGRRSPRSARRPRQHSPNTATSGSCSCSPFTGALHHHRLEPLVSSIPGRKQRMASLVLKMSVSLDGYVAPVDGRLAWVFILRAGYCQRCRQTDSRTDRRLPVCVIGEPLPRHPIRTQRTNAGSVIAGKLRIG
jgi:hypothetical protein